MLCCGSLGVFPALRVVRGSCCAWEAKVRLHVMACVRCRLQGRGPRSFLHPSWTGAWSSLRQGSGSSLVSRWVVRQRPVAAVLCGYLAASWLSPAGPQLPMTTRLAAHSRSLCPTSEQPVSVSAHCRHSWLWWAAVLCLPSCSSAAWWWLGRDFRRWWFSRVRLCAVTLPLPTRAYLVAQLCWFSSAS